MRYLLLITLLAVILIPTKEAGAVAGQQARLDFTSGQPAVTADATSACTDTAVARFDFVSGQPAVVYDATANCTAAAAADTPDEEIIWIESD